MLGRVKEGNGRGLGGSDGRSLTFQHRRNQILCVVALRDRTRSASGPITSLPFLLHAWYSTSAAASGW